MTPAQVKELIDQFPQLDEADANTTLRKLQQMRKFYRFKVSDEETPEELIKQFTGFVDALSIAISAMYAYIQLTNKLAKLDE